VGKARRRYVDAIGIDPESRSGSARDRGIDVVDDRPSDLPGAPAGDLDHLPRNRLEPIPDDRRHGVQVRAREVLSRRNVAAVTRNRGLAARRVLAPEALREITLAVPTDGAEPRSRVAPSDDRHGGAIAEARRHVTTPGRLVET
jgi:hypothetical protein